MKFAKSILTGTGAVVLAGLILALVAPKAAHALAATLVQVANTSASPVPKRTGPAGQARVCTTMHRHHITFAVSPCPTAWFS